MPIIAAVYLFCYFSKNHIYSCLILSFLAKIFLDIQWGNINVDETITLPITLQKYFSGVGSFYTSIMQTQAVFINISNTSVRLVANYSVIAQGFFIVLGY